MPRLKHMIAELHQPIPVETQTRALTLGVIATCSSALFFLFTERIETPLRIAFLSASVIAGLWAMGVRQLSPARKTGAKILPLVLFGLTALWLGLTLTGQHQSALVSLNYVILVITAALLPRNVALAVATYACLLTLLPLAIHFDLAYLGRCVLNMPVIVGISEFIAQTLGPLRARAKQHRYLATLARTTEILSKQDVDAILQETVQQVMDATGSDSCILFLRGEGDQLIPEVINLSPVHYTPRDQDLWQQLRVQVGQGMTGWVAAHRVPLISGDSDRDQRGVHLEGSAPEDASCIVAPMVLGDRVTGVIRASRQGLNQFTAEDLQLLQVLAGQAAIAVEQARLYAETRELAMTDSLTGLANRHYFNREVEPNLRRQTAEHNLAVMMIDLFNFKHINDTYGHLVGDEMLRLTAQVLRESIRRTDMAVRYGGDEFVITMPETSILEAEAVKRRIQEAVAAHNDELQPGEPRLDLNIGVNAGPAVDLRNLLVQADACMYRAKRTEERGRLRKLLLESENVSEKHSLQSVLVLTKIQELKDPYTRGHAERARQLAERVAVHLGMSEDEAGNVGFGAVLHNVGKIVVPPEILQKQGPLTDAEWNIMRRHPEYGARIVGELDLLSDVIPMILYHQERYDGQTSGRHPGYPEGLRGAEIPIGSRIIAVVDAYDAMTSDRSYRTGMAPCDAIAELQRNAGAQFDPLVVEAFLAVLQAQTAQV